MKYNVGDIVKYRKNIFDDDYVLAIIISIESFHSIMSPGTLYHNYRIMMPSRTCLAAQVNLERIELSD